MASSHPSAPSLPRTFFQLGRDAPELLLRLLQRRQRRHGIGAELCDVAVQQITRPVEVGELLGRRRQLRLEAVLGGGEARH